MIFRNKNNWLRLLIGFSMFLLAFHAEGKRSMSELKKIAERLMPADTLINGHGSPDTYWRLLMETNQPFQEALKAAHSGRAKDVQREIGQMLSELQGDDFVAANDSTSMRIVSNLKERAGVCNMFREHSLEIILHPYENAWVSPNGRVMITSSLAQLANLDANLLLAFYAHEIAHYVLQHQFTHLLAINKRKKRNEILADIAAGLTAAASTAADFYAATNGADINWDWTANQNQVIIRKSKEAAQKEVISFGAKYGVEQEFEADMIAYYFLEWIGAGGRHLIDALNLLVNDFEVFRNDESTHPLISDRILLLTNLSTWQNELSSKRQTRSRYISANDDLYAN